jgi:hypothetical protein
MIHTRRPSIASRRLSCAARVVARAKDLKENRSVQEGGRAHRSQVGLPATLQSLLPLRYPDAEAPFLGFG